MTGLTLGKWSCPAELLRRLCVARTVAFGMGWALYLAVCSACSCTEHTHTTHDPDLRASLQL
jgi:hypothetical protein